MVAQENGGRRRMGGRRSKAEKRNFQGDGNWRKLRNGTKRQDPLRKRMEIGSKRYGK